MNKLVVLFVTILLLPSVLAQSLSYSAAIHYSNGKFELKSIVLAEASSTPKSEAGEYTARLFSFSNNILFETKFNINLVKFYGLPVSKETAIRPPEQLNEADIDLLLPYYPNAKILQIVKNEEVLLEVDLSKFATCNENNMCDGKENRETCPSDCNCGNGICDANENYLACSVDCDSGQKDGVCDKIADGICDPDCNSKDDYDCKRINLSLYIYIAIAAVLIIGVFAIKKLKAPKASTKAKK